MRRLIATLAASMLLLSACADGTGTSSPVGMDPDGRSELLPEVPPQVLDLRDRRRMDLDQLKAAIAVVSAGRTWVDPNNGRDLFDDLAATLGKPDYAQTTTEDLSVSPLFMKFLGDAARQICDRMAEEERTMDATERVLYPLVAADDSLLSNHDAVLQNLSQLLLLYHGRALPADSAELNPWEWLFESATFVTNDPVKGWRTVCVGLISHPDFYTY